MLLLQLFRVIKKNVENVSFFDIKKGAGTLFLFVAIMMFSCNNNGIIEIEGVNKIDVETCVRYPEETYIITNQEEFEELVESIEVGENCSFMFPEIDFEERNLLAQFTSITACETFFNIEVNADTETLEYIYKLYFRKSGKCDTCLEKMHWISVPPIPQNYEIVFNKIEY